MDSAGSVYYLMAAFLIGNKKFGSYHSKAGHMFIELCLGCSTRVCWRDVDAGLRREEACNVSTEDGREEKRREEKRREEKRREEKNKMNVYL
jgi:hypothetical protein